MPDGHLDLTVTSPPYDSLRTYNGFSFDFEAIAKELYRVTKDGGVVVWVVGDATVAGSETGTSFKQALYFMDCGFNLHDTMIYEKAQAVFGSNLCYLQSFEYMFVLSKGRPAALNLIRDRKNARSGVESMGAGGLAPDGSKAPRVRKEMKSLGKRKNVWRYGVGGGNTSHPAVFPLQLAADHIKSWSNPGDLVYDPFLGSGTTAKACTELGRYYIGSEISNEYCEIANERLQQGALL
jgi:site-specific DNA-methyltransferase (adenine-specific)